MMPRSPDRAVTSPDRSRSVSDRGFTLIELLVVVAIIALLAGMLMVGIAIVRRSAISTKCVSNLHQIVLGLAAYSGENDGAMVANYSTTLTAGPSYFDFLYPYIAMNSGNDNKNKKNVFVCPASLKMKLSAEGGWDWLWTYGVNQSTHQNFETKVTYLSQISRPADTMDIADGSQDPVGDDSGNASRVITTANSWKTASTYYDDDSGWSAELLSANPDVTKGRLRYRHGGTTYSSQYCNIGWVDGHVSSVPHRFLVKQIHFAAELR